MALTTAERNAANTLFDQGIGLSVVAVVIAIARGTNTNPNNIAAQYSAAYTDAATLVALNLAPSLDVTRPMNAATGG